MTRPKMSPGTGFARVPTAYGDNLEFRRWLWPKAADSPALQRDLTEELGQDFHLFTRLFTFSYDPRLPERRRVGLFVPFPFQEDLADQLMLAVEAPEDVAVEKSRDAGVSWVCVYLAYWMTRFKSGVKTTLISRNQDLVDSHLDDSLFWKLMFVHQRLPDWLRPPVVRTKNNLFFPRTGSINTGQPTTEKVGVGGRSTFILLDEYAKIPKAETVWGDTADNSGCRVVVSTHEGPDTHFYRLTHPEPHERPTKTVRVHWSQDPRKNAGAYRWDQFRQEVEVLDKSYPFPPDYKFDTTGTPGGPFAGIRSVWYDNEDARRKDRRFMARNLDMDPAGAKDQFFDTNMVRELLPLCREPVWVGDIPYAKDTGKPGRPVANPGGKLRLWRPPTHGGLIPPGVYALGVDVSHGVGRTPSVVVVGDKNTGEKVAVWADNNTDPKSLGAVVKSLGLSFATEAGTPATVAWEANGPGGEFGRVLAWDYGYRRVFLRNRDSFEPDPSDRMGWASSDEAKAELLGAYRSALGDRRFFNPERAALLETLNFHHHGKGVRHSTTKANRGVNHGDVVVADALCSLLAARPVTAPEPKDTPPAVPPVGSLAEAIAEYERSREDRWTNGVPWRHR